MTTETFEASLWFNSGKDAMKKQLEDTKENAGVGIHIGKCSMYFDKEVKNVKLEFDDGSSGIAKVKKDSWNNCTHLIQICIGEWARKNGLWKEKLRLRRVPVYITIVKDKKEFLIRKIEL